MLKIPDAQQFLMGKETTNAAKEAYAKRCGPFKTIGNEWFTH